MAAMTSYHMQWLKTALIYALTVLEAKVKKRFHGAGNQGVRRAAFLLEALGEKQLLCLCQLLGALPASWACDPLLFHCDLDFHCHISYLTFYSLPLPLS